MTRSSFHLTTACLVVLSFATAASSQTKLNITFSGQPLTNLDDMYLSPDGTTLLLNGEFASAGGGFPGDILLKVPVAGGAATLFTSSSPAGDADLTAISPGGTVVFAGDSDTTGTLGLGANANNYWSLPLSSAFPTLPTQLTTSTTTPFEVSSPGFSPDGSIFYFAQELIDDDPNTAADESFFGIVSMPIGGGAISQLTPSFGQPGAVGGIGVDENFSFDVDPNGSTIYFSGFGTVAGQDTQIYAVPSDGSSAPVSIGLDTSGFDPNIADIDELRLTPDGQTIVFIGDLISDGVDELFTVPTTGGAPTRISQEPVSGGDVQSFQISPDGNSVLYVSDEVVNGTDSLFLTSISGGPNVQVSPDPTEDPNGVPVNGDVVDNVFSGFFYSPDGTQAFYISDLETGANIDRAVYVIDIPDLPTTPGDFNSDGAVDGIDFLIWQQGGSPDPLSQSDLTDWETNYGMSASVGSVPEPSSVALLTASAFTIALFRRRG